MHTVIAFYKKIARSINRRLSISHTHNFYKLLGFKMKRIAVHAIS